MEPEIVNEYLSPEIISALISAAGAIIAAIIAWFTARGTTKREIRKLKEEWKREDEVSLERKYSEMASAVSRYIQSSRPGHQREALEAISSIQMVSSGLSASALRALYAAVVAGDIDQCQTQLSEVISLRQQIIRHK